jgi:hypothetical protein
MIHIQNCISFLELKSPIGTTEDSQGWSAAEPLVGKRKGKSPGQGRKNCIQSRIFFRPVRARHLFMPNQGFRYAPPLANFWAPLPGLHFQLSGLTPSTNFLAAHYEQKVRPNKLVDGVDVSDLKTAGGCEY